MLFSSIPFLYYFLPIVVIVYYCVPFKFKNLVLLLSSLIFYGWGEPKYLILMVFTIIIFYFCGILIEKAKTPIWNKIWLIISIVMSLSILAVFKYADFAIDSINKITGIGVPLLKLALPVGISFYTFQCLSYTIDVYRGNVDAQKNLIDFATYVCLFPQLIAGPIIRYIDISKELKNRKHSFRQFYDGMLRFLIGLGKKIIIANQLGELVSICRASNEPSILLYWIYAIAFMLHIYFDFSGYSDMAIGLGKIFGFNFIENFNYPYMSKSVTEFWRRWHMSLGSWFKDYVYIPLGGNRVSKIKWILNIFIVWSLTGLWHGAAWNFVAWGIFYAVILLLEKIFLKDKMPKIIQNPYTLFIVMIGFVLFNATNMKEAFEYSIGLFSFGKIPLSNDFINYYVNSYLVIINAAVIGATNYPKQLARKIKYKMKNQFAWLESLFMLVLLLVCTAYLIDGSFNPFLYFRF